MSCYLFPYQYSGAPETYAPLATLNVGATFAVALAGSLKPGCHPERSEGSLAAQRADPSLRSG